MIDKEDVRIPQIKEELSKCFPLEVGSEVTALLQLYLNDRVLGLIWAYWASDVQTGPLSTGKCPGHQANSLSCHSSFLFSLFLLHTEFLCILVLQAASKSDSMLTFPRP